MKQLRGRVAVVTGGASGIGLAMARRFGEEGMRVVLADVEGEALEKAARELAAAGIDAAPVVCDVRSWDSVAALADAALARFGAVHVVCNNAGVGFWMLPASERTDAAIRARSRCSSAASRTT